jgi:hypothetical protein
MELKMNISAMVDDAMKRIQTQIDRAVLKIKYNMAFHDLYYAEMYGFSDEYIRAVNTELDNLDLLSGRKVAAS